MAEPVRKKLVVVGDGACGKTSLLVVFSKDVFMDSYFPTVFETDLTTIEVDDKMIELVLWDTAGQEDYRSLRPFSYRDTDIFLLCFSVDNPDSFTNVSATWVPEVRYYSPNVPIILVGNKIDLRDNEDTKTELKRLGQSPVSTQDGIELANKINAFAYVECSSKTREGIRNVFETAARAALLKRRWKGIKKLCCFS
ncbi:hypothetical protein ACJMK2_016576 [Sinanodonta woodiana]|uniref:Rho GTPase n=1 Tax=Sinanodonta woodiana TaxID=1069815 RepID=A0ABD3UU17_SINWO